MVPITLDAILRPLAPPELHACTTPGSAQRRRCTVDTTTVDTPIDLFDRLKILKGIQKHTYADRVTCEILFFVLDAVLGKLNRDETGSAEPPKATLNRPR